MIKHIIGSPIGGLMLSGATASFSRMNSGGMKRGKWRRTILLNFIIGTVLAFPLVALASQPVWPGTSTVSRNAGSKDHLSFQCPRAFIGIKGDMLPTHWQADDRGGRLRLGYASIDGAYMICTYRSPNNSKQRFGPVRRLAPRGYRCISDGIGSFRCQKKQTR